MVTPVISEFLKKVEGRRESHHPTSADIRAIGSIFSPFAQLPEPHT
jgi:hypothetical protein